MPVGEKRDQHLPEGPPLPVCGPQAFISLQRAAYSTHKPQALAQDGNPHASFPPVLDPANTGDITSFPWDKNGYTSNLWIYIPCPCTSW